MRLRLLCTRVNTLDAIPLDANLASRKHLAGQMRYTLRQFCQASVTHSFIFPPL